jgi:hypothetical protein
VPPARLLTHNTKIDAAACMKEERKGIRGLRVGGVQSRGARPSELADPSPGQTDIGTAPLIFPRFGGHRC